MAQPYQIHTSTTREPSTSVDSDINTELRKPSNIVYLTAANFGRKTFTSNDEVIRDGLLPRKNVARPPIELTNLDRAFDLIGRIIYEDYTPVERSNIFDEWKEILLDVSDNSIGNYIEFRQILGIIISSIERKDIVDFERDVLLQFQEATNLLRKTKLTLVDTEKTYKAFDDLGLVTVNQFLTTDEEHIKELDDLIDSFLPGARENDPG